MYTVSTTFFKSLKEAENMLKKWEKNDSLKPGTVVIEVGAIYEPVMKLIKKKV